MIYSLYFSICVHMGRKTLYSWVWVIFHRNPGKMVRRWCNAQADNHVGIPKERGEYDLITPKEIHLQICIWFMVWLLCCYANWIHFVALLISFPGWTQNNFNSFSWGYFSMIQLGRFCLNILQFITVYAHEHKTDTWSLHVG